MDSEDAPNATQIQFTGPFGEAVNSNTSKKRRNPNACELCRTKKGDSELMPGNRCTECIASNWECVRPTKKKNFGNSVDIDGVIPGPHPPIAGSHCSCCSSNPYLGQHRLHAVVESLIAQLPPQITSSVSPTLSQISSHIESLERQVAELKAASARSDSVFVRSSPRKSGNISKYHSSSSETTADELPDSNEAQLGGKLAELHIRPGKGGKHFGPSSTMALVGMALKVILDSRKDSEIIPDLRGIRRPTYWSILPWETELDKDLFMLDFPPVDLMTELIDIYFKQVNNLLPLLHRPTFLKSIRDNQHILNPQFGETVLLVCANAARWSEDPRVLLEADDIGHSAGWRWFRQVRLFRREPYSTIPSVYELQSNLLSALYLGGSSQPELAWVLLGLGIRYAVEVGAHRKRALATADAELWKRAFWILWCYDGLMSSFMGRPRATLADDYDVELPIDCDDEYWETENPEDAFKQPAGKPSKLSALISFIQLVKIAEYAQINLFSIKAVKEIASGKRDAQDIVAYLDSELNRWLGSVPKHLRWDNFMHVADHEAYKNLDPETGMLLGQAAMLQGMYHHIHILAHRPFIFTSKPDSPMFTSSWTVCTHSARACLKILKVYAPFTTVHFTIVAAAVIILLEKWKLAEKSTQARASKFARESVVECLNFLKECEDRWIGAGKLGDVLRELLYLDDLVSNPGLSPTTQMGRYQLQKPKFWPDDIFSMATDSFPTVDLDFLGRSFGSGDDSFSMLF